MGNQEDEEIPIHAAQYFQTAFAINNIITIIKLIINLWGKIPVMNVRA